MERYTDTQGQVSVYILFALVWRFQSCMLGYVMAD